MFGCFDASSFPDMVLLRQSWHTDGGRFGGKNTATDKTPFPSQKGDSWGALMGNVHIRTSCCLGLIKGEPKNIPKRKRKRSANLLFYSLFKEIVKSYSCTRYEDTTKCRIWMMQWSGEWQETRAEWQKMKRAGRDIVTDGLKTNVHGVNPGFYYLQTFKRIGQLCSPQLMSSAKSNAMEWLRHAPHHKTGYEIKLSPRSW